MPDLSLLPPSATIDGDDLLIGGVSLRELAERVRHARLRDRRGCPARPGPRVRQRLRPGGTAQPGLLRGRRHSRRPRSSGSSCRRAWAATSSAPANCGIALAAGADPATILMHGNAKSDDDIRAALQARIGYIVVDGFDDIDRISRLATDPVPVLLRTSPGIDSATHAALATGGAGSKFGIPVEQVPEAVRRMAADPADRPARAARPHRLADPGPGPVRGRGRRPGQPGRVRRLRPRRRPGRALRAGGRRARHRRVRRAR